MTDSRADADELVAIDDSGRGLRLSFTRQVDRFGHSIAKLGQHDPVPLLVSREGDDRASWPPSPPFQQLSCEQREVGRVALLVGMAGKSHWSASIETSRHPPRLAFDVACRVDGPPSWLGSSYQLTMGPHARCDCTPNQVQIGAAGCVEYRLRTLPGGDWVTRWECADGGVRLQVVLPGLPAGARTIRWKYCLELVV